MSPFLFCVPSTLYTGCGHCKCLMGSCSSFAYCMLIKFLVTPESRSAVVLALFHDRWMNICNCIDFHIEKYILSDPTLLIKAAQIRPPKNFPPELPFLSSTLLGLLSGACSIVDRWSQWQWSRSHFHYLLDSSQWVGPCTCWCISVWWGNCEQSVLVPQSWNTHLVSLFGLRHPQLWLHFPSVNLSLDLSSFLLVLWLGQGLLGLVDYSTLLVQ